MSTRAVIIRYNAELKQFETAYKHHDGYGIAGYLNVHYTTPEKQEAFLNAIMQAKKELRDLAPTVEALEIAADDYYGPTFTTLEEQSKKEEFIRDVISYGDAEYIIVHTPIGWQEFSPYYTYYHESKDIKLERPQDVAAAANMMDSNNELDELYYLLIDLEAAANGTPAAWPKENPRPGDIRWGYIWGKDALSPEDYLYPVNSSEARKIADKACNELMGCSKGWAEFQQVTGATLLNVTKGHELYIKINPRSMANKANIIKLQLRPGEMCGYASFGKIVTRKGVKKLEKLDGFWQDVENNRFLHKFREITGLQTFSPFETKEKPAPRWWRAEDCGYTPLFGYWQILYKSCKEGTYSLEKAFSDIFNTSIWSPERYYKNITELVLAANHLAWHFSEQGNDAITKKLVALYEMAADYARDTFTGEAAEYFFRITD